MAKDKQKGDVKGKKVTLKNLTAPIKIGPFELKNRMALAPMNETMADAHGQATPQLLSYYAARAKGGAAVVITGAISATRLCGQYAWGRNPCLFHTGHLQGMSTLADNIHYFGSLACAQMLIGWGRQGHSYDPHLAPYAPTAGLPYEMSLDHMNKGQSELVKKNEFARLGTIGHLPREMMIAEILSEQREFAASCQLAVAGGFDMIEVHGPHGYLTHEFLSPFTNKRTDMYGGEWRNRKRFINDMVEKVRYACPGAVLGVRISAEEHFEGGLTVEEMVDVAKDLEARGADYISLSDGGGYDETGFLVPSVEFSKHIPESAAAFRRALKIPVVCASQHDPVKADADIGAGKFDISALGRQLFIDPEYPNKVLEGRLADIVRCRKCSICVQRCLIGLTPACPWNPKLGREYLLDEYKMGMRSKSDPMLPKAMTNASMPALDKPWWKREVPLIEKSWRGWQGLKPDEIP
jgi:2,4-dienoyl-CoA reductase-like NADH-dependent reductase (Old Yellow Enzyme family)